MCFLTNTAKNTRTHFSASWSAQSTHPEWLDCTRALSLLCSPTVLGCSSPTTPSSEKVTLVNSTLAEIELVGQFFFSAPTAESSARIHFELQSFGSNRGSHRSKRNSPHTKIQNCFVLQVPHPCRHRITIALCSNICSRKLKREQQILQTLPFQTPHSKQ